MLKINKVIILSVFALSQLFAVAQNNTNSPYTRFGYGELANRSFAAGRAMGGIGYGLRSPQQINPLNPASYSRMDSMTFILDFGVAAQFSRFDDGLNKQNNTNGNLEYVAMQFPIINRVAMSIGLLPYSYVGYDFGSINSVGDSKEGTQYRQQFLGSGGLNELYAGLSVDIWKKRLAIGVNAGYLFGNIQHEKMLQILESDAVEISDWRKIRVRDIKFDFGVQYTQPISKKEHVTVGAVFSPKNSLSNHVYTIHQEFQGNTLIESTGDTAKNVPMGIPNSYGLGFTYVKMNKLTVGADFLYEEWKKMDFPFSDKETHFENRYKIAAGAEFIPNYMGSNFFNRVRYRAGAHFGNSYLQVKDAGYNEYGVSLGFGLPLIDNRSLVNVAFEYTKVAPKLDTLIKEQYFRITLNYTFNEFWFFKRKL